MNVIASARPRALRDAWLERYPLTGPAPAGWQKSAACRSVTSEVFFDNARTGEACTICVSCPVRLWCLQNAFQAERDLPIGYVTGVVGGLRQTDRQVFLRARPELRTIRTCESTVA